MKKILFIILGLSLYSPIFGQTVPNKKDSINTAKAYKADSINVDKFVIVLVDYAFYHSFDNAKKIGTKMHKDNLYTVYFYPDSIIVNVVNLKPGNVSTTELIMAGDYNLFGLTGGDIKIYKRLGHWYHICPKIETNWFLNTCLPDIHRALISP